MGNSSIAESFIKYERNHKFDALNACATIGKVGDERGNLAFQCYQNILKSLSFNVSNVYNTTIFLLGNSVIRHYSFSLFAIIEGLHEDISLNRQIEKHLCRDNPLGPTYTKSDTLILGSIPTSNSSVLFRGSTFHLFFESIRPFTSFYAITEILKMCEMKRLLSYICLLGYNSF
jgi:hypothetical protein